MCLQRKRPERARVAPAGCGRKLIEQLFQAVLDLLVHFFLGLFLGGILDHFLSGVAFTLDAQLILDFLLGSLGSLR